MQWSGMVKIPEDWSRSWLVNLLVGEFTRGREMHW